MKKKLLLLVFNSIFLIFNSYAQSGQWTWMNGDSATEVPGVFGTQGIPAAANTPMSMYEMCDWVDSNGNFWLFGGLNVSGERNDLWKYDPVTYEWTWIKGSGLSGSSATYGVQGIPSALNNPGGRSWGAWSFVDNNNNLWMYGGIGYDGVGGYECLSDLWKYDISTNEWTWMQGPDSGTYAATYGTKGVSSPANTPGARAESDASWTDKNNNLWLFGGAIYTPQNGGWSLTGFGNDLWKYDMSTNSWAWMKGANTVDQAGTYGTKGVAGINNVPAARGTYTKWTDAAGDLWLFSGYNFFEGSHNDVWKYTVSSNQWTWMSGTNLIDDAGSAISKCNPATSNTPSARYENRASATDACGNFWTMGGNGGGNTPYNDLWKYNPVNLQWTWVSGDNTGNSVPVYGNKGVSAAANVPNGKMGAGGWMDKSGNFWVFGGMSQLWFRNNDMWRYVPDTSCGACVNILTPVAELQASDSIICANDCISFTDHSINATSWQWSFTGGNPPSSTDQNPQSVCYLNPGIYDVKLVVSNSGGTDSITYFNYINASTAPPVPGITQSGDTLNCSTDTSYIGYQWYYNDTLIGGATGPQYVASQNGNYNISVINKNGCSVAVGINVVINGVKDFASFNYPSIFPNPSKDQFTIYGIQFTGRITLELYTMLGELINNTEFTKGEKEITVDVRVLPDGIYFIRLTVENDSKWIGRFVKE